MVLNFSNLSIQEVETDTGSGVGYIARLSKKNKKEESRAGKVDL